MIARQFNVSFALHTAARALPLNADRAFPVDVAGGLRDDQLLILDLGLEREADLELRRVDLDMPAGGIGDAGRGAAPMVQHIDLQNITRQLQSPPIRSNEADVGRDGLPAGIANHVKHEFTIVLELNAEPVPAPAAQREEISPLVIHPSLAADLEGLPMIKQRAPDRHASTRVVV